MPNGAAAKMKTERDCSIDKYLLSMDCSEVRAYPVELYLSESRLAQYQYESDALPRTRATEDYLLPILCFVKVNTKQS